MLQDSRVQTAQCPAQQELMALTAHQAVTAKTQLSVPLWTAPAHVSQGGMGWTALLTAPVEPGAWAVTTPACATMEGHVMP